MPAELPFGDLDNRQPRWKHAATLHSALTFLQYAYPLFMLVFFLAAFTIRSIAATRANSNIAKPTTTGPGGKPLPATDPPFAALPAKREMRSTDPSKLPPARQGR